ncbi:MAG: undecaprenyldiphospho-muramoylpentapeptide beta-N-acetylglucosaminyltransferase [Elusimicrobiota bacterium]|jgi:UDP-N-acetylglucosamine--N-acetylmuramyl-(pentapeptide) pyrophosphoryl-undecaprenol N-acetylglucosamine transferase|nr:undecaprenyldiphospho-muramoylpentapeptide beta-N-acetylglucosaminyltransferase [Elusimicrobiota bacterium]
MKGAIVIIAISGTGGHIYPGITIAEVLKEKGYHPILWTSKNEVAIKIVQNSGFEFIPFSMRGMPRKLSFKFIVFVFNFFLAFLKSCFYIHKLKPAFVFGTGGYIEVPAILAAKVFSKKTFIHEQNIVPGKANVLLNHIVDKTFISFARSQNFFKKECLFVGFPLRKNIFSVDKKSACQNLGLKEDVLTVLIFGGSLGAAKINDIAFEVVVQFAARQKVQAIHITGKDGYQDIAAKSSGKDFYVVKNYLHNIYEAYAAADIIVCRAGAGTIFEIKTLNKPAIFIPFPYAAGNHQFLNAQEIKEEGFAEVIEERDLTADKLLSVLEKLKSSARRPSKPLDDGIFAQDKIVKYIASLKN